MKALYVFPHPDDESFGPSLGISQQRRAGHEVHLLTLTRGGATKLRHKFGYTVEQMGEVRHREMHDVAKVLDLTSMVVLDFPDSGLKELDPRLLEDAVRERIVAVRPDVVVTYAVHGISGFHDHLVAHALVKRVYCELREGGETNLRRLAFFTLEESSAPEGAGEGGGPRLHFSTEAEIDCRIVPGPDDVDAFQKALDAYVTYQDMIEKTGVRKFGGRGIPGRPRPAARRSLRRAVRHQDVRRATLSPSPFEILARPIAGKEPFDSGRFSL